MIWNYGIQFRCVLKTNQANNPFDHNLKEMYKIPWHLFYKCKQNGISYCKIDFFLYFWSVFFFSREHLKSGREPFYKNVPVNFKSAREKEKKCPWTSKVPVKRQKNEQKVPVNVPVNIFQKTAFTGTFNVHGDKKKHCFW